jgi:hypothetical protein
MPMQHSLELHDKKKSKEFSYFEDQSKNEKREAWGDP